MSASKMFRKKSEPELQECETIVVVEIKGNKCEFTSDDHVCDKDLA